MPVDRSPSDRRDPRRSRQDDAAPAMSADPPLPHRGAAPPLNVADPARSGAGKSGGEERSTQRCVCSTPRVGSGGASAAARRRASRSGTRSHRRSRRRRLPRSPGDAGPGCDEPTDC